MAAETHHELGPEYQSAVIESFLDRVGREIDARVDARMALARQYSPPAAAPPAPAPVQARSQPTTRLAIVSMALGIPLSGISVALAPSAQLTGLVVIWLAIAVINIAYAISLRPPSGDR